VTHKAVLLRDCGQRHIVIPHRYVSAPPVCPLASLCEQSPFANQQCTPCRCRLTAVPTTHMPHQAVHRAKFKLKATQHGMNQQSDITKHCLKNHTLLHFKINLTDTAQNTNANNHQTVKSLQSFCK